MLAINSKHKMSDANRFKFESTTHFLATPSEMFKLFRSEQPDIDIDTIREAMDNTQGIVDKCKDFKIKKSLVMLPLIHECKERNIDEADFFEELIMKGFKEKIRLGLIPKEKLSVYRARIKEEFELLKAKSFIRYFLIVWELINWCLKNDIMTGPGRGSCSGCLIAWLIGITGVDPLKYDLLFARFISPDRCFTPETLVKTLNGNKLINEIIPGEIIVNKNGGYERVERQKTFKVQEKIYKFETENGIVESTGDHKFPIWDTLLNKEVEKKAKDINVKSDFFLSLT